MFLSQIQIEFKPISKSIIIAEVIKQMTCEVWWITTVLCIYQISPNKSSQLVHSSPRSTFCQGRYYWFLLSRCGKQRLWVHFSKPVTAWIFIPNFLCLQLWCHKVLLPLDPQAPVGSPLALSPSRPVCDCSERPFQSSASPENTWWFHIGCKGNQNSGLMNSST